MIMAQNILSVKDVTKIINKRKIIKGINLEISEGEIYGFLGPNGAGKSTTLRMIVGLSKPTTGEITIAGYSIAKNYVKAMGHVGCIIEEPALYEYMSGLKNLEILGSMSKNVSKKDIAEAVELVGMSHRIGDQVRTYSMGMKQRIGLAQALIHNPKLLILDEPTNGLDPQGIYEFRQIIKNLVSKKGISVLLSSHLISEIQLMCDKVAIINNGKIIETAKVDDLLFSNQIYWTLDHPKKGKNILESKFDIEANIIENQLVASLPEHLIESVNTVFMNEGIKIKYVSTKKKTLEDLFLELTAYKAIE
jgi:ABC-2 type transport system ATP-binding protein